MPPYGSVYQIKISLRGSDPLIWRQVLVPADCSLVRLHLILQTVMGWENYHLHAFKILGQEYSDPQDDEWGDRGTRDEHDFCLMDIDLVPVTTFEYIYDFGDGWLHDLEVEKIHSDGCDAQIPRCLAGELSGPPEDVGGLGGYYEYLRALKNRRHPEYKEWLAWRGPFDPLKFDLDVINKRLFWLSEATGAKSAGLHAADVLDLIQVYYPSLSRWAEGLDGEFLLIAEALSLRRDMLVLLTYLQENKVIGTQSTGNLPLKPAQEISAGFVDPPIWKFELGNYVSHVRSSADIWAIYFLQVLAEVGELVAGGLGRRLRLTRAGAEFMAAPPALQVWYLLAVWWTQVNWLIAFPYEGAGDQLPFQFNKVVGEALLSLPADGERLVAPFADQLIEHGELKWYGSQQANTHEELIRLVKDGVLNPLIDLGILTARYESQAHVWGETKEFVAFRLTRFGRHFLEPLVIPGRWAGE
jgi:hypothetical protein